MPLVALRRAQPTPLHMQPEQKAAPAGKSIMHLIRAGPKAAVVAVAPRIQYTLQQIRAIGAHPSLKVRNPPTASYR